MIEDRSMSRPLTAPSKQLLHDQMAGDPSRWVQTPWELAARLAAIEAAVRADALPTVEQRAVIMAMLRGEQTCERSHRDGERYAHVHADTVHGWGVVLMSLARASLAATPAPAPEADR